MTEILALIPIVLVIIGAYLMRDAMLTLYRRIVVLEEQVRTLQRAMKQHTEPQPQPADWQPYRGE